MDLTVNQNGFRNLGTGGEMPNVGGVDAKKEVAGRDGVSGSVANLTVTTQPSDLRSSEPIADIPAAALVRDDALGNLVSSAFNLPPPPMPEFK
jgi:hypothetical protein